jgi:hypothetical protein
MVFKVLFEHLKGLPREISPVLHGLFMLIHSVVHAAFAIF